MVGDKMTTYSTYKPSNKGSAVGLVVLFLALFVGGAAISWLYLTLNSVIPIIYLRILFAVGAGFGMGAIGSLAVKKFKLRAPIIAVVVTVAALLFVTYLKWSIYVANDYKKYFYDDLEDIHATDLLSAFQQDITEEQAERIIAQCELLEGFSFDDDMLSAMGTDSATMSAALHFLRPLGDNFGEIYRTLYGETVDEIMDNAELIKRKQNISLYKYLYEERELPTRSTFWLMAHPGTLMQDIKDINEVGRWSIRNRRYGGYRNTDDYNAVNGIILWLVWLGELLILCAPAVSMVYTTSNAPYIEGEDDWAVTDKNPPNFMFEDNYPDKQASMGIVKSEIIKNPEYLFSMKAISVIDLVPDRYYKVTFSHSKYYDEVYITVTYSVMTNPRKNQRNNTDIIKFMRVDADYLATLYGIFDQPVPPLCQGHNRAEDVKKQNNARNDALAHGIPLSPQRPKSTGAEAIFDEPSIFAQAKAQQETDSYAQQELEKEKSSNGGVGEMDGIDTSKLDLDNIDFSKM